MKFQKVLKIRADTGVFIQVCCNAHVSKQWVICDGGASIHVMGLVPYAFRYHGFFATRNTITNERGLTETEHILA